MLAVGCFIPLAQNSAAVLVVDVFCFCGVSAGPFFSQAFFYYGGGGVIVPLYWSWAFFVPAGF